MKTIKKDELYASLSGFLKSKGIELTEGSYAQRINRACDLLTDAVNTTQEGVTKAKVKVDQKLGELRQSIHEATAPKPPSEAAKPGAAPAAAAPTPAPAAKPAPPKPAAAKAAPAKPKTQGKSSGPARKAVAKKTKK